MVAPVTGLTAAGDGFAVAVVRRVVGVGGGGGGITWGALANAVATKRVKNPAMSASDVFGFSAICGSQIGVIAPYRIAEDLVSECKESFC